MALKASLQLVAGVRKGKTYLQSAFFSQPFKVMNITEDSSEKELQLMMMNVSPGILDGDDYFIEIQVMREGAVSLYTQSYQRLFAMTKGASQLMKVQLEEDAALYFLPHPIVPHKNSCFRSVNHFFLSKRSTLIWGEVLTPGRKSCGEVFTYSSYSSKTDIYMDDKLILKENLLLQPSLKKPGALGGLEGYTHQAGFICLNGDLDLQKIIEKANAILGTKEDLIYGTTSLSGMGFLVRILGHKAEKMHQLLLELAVCCKEEISKTVPEVTFMNASPYAS